MNQLNKPMEQQNLTDSGSAPEPTVRSEWFRGPAENEDDENDAWEPWISEVTRQELDAFKFPVLDALRRRPCYHTATLGGPFNVKAMVKDQGTRLFRSHTILNRQGQPLTERLLFHLGDARFACYDHGSLMVYAPTPEAAAALTAEFRRYLNPPQGKTVGFHILSVADGTVRTEFVLVERPLTLSDEALALHYGEHFPDWEKRWLVQLAERRSGVSVLFGPPGSGKTTYLRALMGKLIDRFAFYYLPVSEFEALASPNFAGFWISQTRRRGKTQKIAILEDAEDLLLPRDGSNRDKVSNLLNIADGFLGDYLKLHIIATTNLPMRSLDPAVTRPGRLMGSREFSRLSREQAQRLAASKGIQLPQQPDYSLAEIYCHVPVGNPAARFTRLGFTKLA